MWLVLILSKLEWWNIDIGTEVYTWWERRKLDSVLAMLTFQPSSGGFSLHNYAVVAAVGSVNSFVFWHDKFLVEWNVKLTLRFKSKTNETVK